MKIHNALSGALLIAAALPLQANGGLAGAGVLSGQHSGQGGLLGLDVVNGDNLLGLQLANLPLIGAPGSPVAAPRGPVPLTNPAAGLLPELSLSPLAGLAIANNGNAANGSLIGAGVLSGADTGNSLIAGAAIANGGNSGNGGLIGISVLSAGNSGNGGVIGASVLSGNNTGNAGLLGVSLLSGDNSGNVGRFGLPALPGASGLPGDGLIAGLPGLPGPGGVSLLTTLFSTLNGPAPLNPGIVGEGLPLAGGLLGVRIVNQGGAGSGMVDLGLLNTDFLASLNIAGSRIVALPPGTPALHAALSQLRLSLRGLSGGLRPLLLGLPGTGGAFIPAGLGGNDLGLGGLLELSLGASADSGDRLLAVRLLDGPDTGNGDAVAISVLGSGNNANGRVLGASILGGSNSGNGGLLGLGLLSGENSGLGGLLGGAVLNGQNSGNGGLAGLALLAGDGSGNTGDSGIAGIQLGSGSSSGNGGLTQISLIGDGANAAGSGSLTSVLEGIGQLILANGGDGRSQVGAGLLNNGDRNPGSLLDAAVIEDGALLDIDVLDINQLRIELLGPELGSLSEQLAQGLRNAGLQLLPVLVLLPEGGLVLPVVLPINPILAGINSIVLGGAGTPVGVELLTGSTPIDGDLIGAGVIAGNGSGNGDALGIALLTGDDSGNGALAGAAVLGSGGGSSDPSAAANGGGNSADGSSNPVAGGTGMAADLSPVNVIGDQGNPLEGSLAGLDSVTGESAGNGGNNNTANGDSATLIAGTTDALIPSGNGEGIVNLSPFDGEHIALAPLPGLQIDDLSGNGGNQADAGGQTSSGADNNAAQTGAGGQNPDIGSSGAGLGNGGNTGSPGLHDSANGSAGNAGTGNGINCVADVPEQRHGRPLHEERRCNQESRGDNLARL